MRNILIYSTTGKNGITIPSQSTNWESLQRDLSSNSITYDNMKAIVGETRVTLESPLAQLPQGDFTLFLMPKKTKSGNDYSTTPYKECRNIIKNLITKEGDVAKKFFSDGDKNYTQTTTDYMRKRIAAWFKKFGTSKVEKEVVKKEVIDEISVVGEVVESAKISANIKLTTEEEVLSHLNVTISNAVKNNLFCDYESEINDVNVILSEISEKIIDKRIKEEEAAKAAALEAEIQKRVAEELAKKTQELDKQAEAMRREFNDLR